MNKKIKELKESRVKLIADAREMITAAETAKKELTTDEDIRYEKMLSDAAILQKKIEREENLLELEKEKPVIVKTSDEPTTEPVDVKKQQEMEMKVFRNYIKQGTRGLSPEEKEIYQKKMVENEVTRALGTGSGSIGGYTVPYQFQLEIEKAMKEFGGMLKVSRIINSAKGGTLDWPTNNDTSGTGYWLGENTQVLGASDISFGTKQFSDYIAAVDLQRVSLKLMDDSAFDMEGFIRDALAERLARFLNNAYTLGDGSSKPRGVTIDATTGKTSASATVIAFDEVIDLKFSLDPAYRPKATWMFNDSTLKAISKLKDLDGRYLWSPSIREGEPDLILGSPLVINQDIASIGASAKSILYGDFSKYIIRNIGNIILMRLNERYADYLQVGFIGFQRTDGKLINAGTNPIVRMVQPSS